MFIKLDKQSICFASQSRSTCICVVHLNWTLLKRGFHLIIHVMSWCVLKRLTHLNVVWLYPDNAFLFEWVNRFIERSLNYSLTTKYIFVKNICYGRGQGKSCLNKNILHILFHHRTVYQREVEIKKYIFNSPSQKYQSQDWNLVSLPGHNKSNLC